MSEQGFQFRTAAFGGFRKEDVLDYLEQSAKAHEEKASALERELDQTKAALAGAEEREAQLLDQAQELREANEKLAAELSAAAARQQELEIQAAQAGEEAERLRHSAEAYEIIKDRTAGIELEAHGRAQLIEDEGRRKAKELQRQLSEWFDRVCGAYEQMRSDLDDTLDHAMREMRQVDQKLAEAGQSFQGPDEALKGLRAVLEDMEGMKKPPVPLPLDVDEQ